MNKMKSIDLYLSTGKYVESPHTCREVFHNLVIDNSSPRTQRHQLQGQMMLFPSSSDMIPRLLDYLIGFPAAKPMIQSRRRHTE